MLGGEIKTRGLSSVMRLVVVLRGWASFLPTVPKCLQSAKWSHSPPSPPCQRDTAICTSSWQPLLPCNLTFYHKFQFLSVWNLPGMRQGVAVQDVPGGYLRMSSAICVGYDFINPRSLCVPLTFVKLVFKAWKAAPWIVCDAAKKEMKRT